ncbi:MAG TPA: aminotransferase class III-fold pyridoxal phosphate-dependent enzyme [Azospirillaceae bacterium]|nr:aminotransferase class III-fold pyridoxal phosphate-dependent enzyme [Azospirillaceae bacterium]
MPDTAYSLSADANATIETRWRRIVTPIPAPGAVELMAALETCESRAMHGQLPVEWDRAEDFQVFDRHGNAWIDFTSSIFVANAGHANPRIKAALLHEIENGAWHAYTYVTAVRARYLKRLVDAAPAPLTKAWLASSGSEATECGLRLMRLYAQAKGKRRPGILCWNGAYHGRTMGAASLSGSPASRAWMGFDPPHVFRLDFPFPWTLEGRGGAEQAKADIARLEAEGVDPAQDLGGLLMESYQGWAAAFYPQDYVRTFADWARAHDVLVGFDDIQAGFARTGKMFAYEHYGVEADVLCLGKGISSSLPLSATLARADVMDLFGVGTMSATHSAHPLSCAAALANLEEIERLDLPREAARRGALLFDRLEGLRRRFPDRVSHVLGRGLIAAVLLKDPVTGAPDGATASAACRNALRNGLILVHTGRESIKIGPPLTIADDALMEGLDVLEAALAEAVAANAILDGAILDGAR